MKFYIYDSPSKKLPKFLIAATKKFKFLKWPSAAVLVVIWAILIPPAYVAVKVGEIGHAIFGWCGFDFR